MYRNHIDICISPYVLFDEKAHNVNYFDLCMDEVVPSQVHNLIFIEYCSFKTSRHVVEGRQSGGKEIELW